MKVVEKDKRPYLCLKALSLIKKGTEIRYNYGLKSLWWRGKVINYFININVMYPKQFYCVENRLDYVEK